MSKKRTKRKIKQRRRFKPLILVILATLALLCVFIHTSYNRKNNSQLDNIRNATLPEWIDSQIIEIDGVSRDGRKLDSVKDIVIHYVGNPGSTAQQNHDFYAGSQSEVSSHFIVGLKGEIILCVPLDEMSAASNWRNNDTISIEVCHPDDTGKFNKKTYKSLIKLTAWLLDLCNIDENHIIRHYDITGKECPRYYVKHEDKWKKFKNDVKNFREKQMTR